MENNKNVVKKALVENVSNLTEEYRKVLKKGLNTKVIPYYKEDPYRYRIQSYTLSEKFIYLTAHGEAKDPSVIMVYDKTGAYCGKILLPKEVGRDAHVGGISFDKKHNVLFITGKKGEVLALNSKRIEQTISNSLLIKKNFVFDLDEDQYITSDFLFDGSVSINDSFPKETAKYYLNYYKKQNKKCPYTKEEMIEKFSKIKLKAASIHFDQNDQKLYVSTFSADTTVFVYDVTFEKNKINYSLYTVYGLSVRNTGPINDSTNLPYGVQGVSTYHESSGTTYLLLSSSYGKSTSSIAKFKIEGKTLNFAGQAILKGQIGIQNMNIDKKGNIVLNYENCSFGTDASSFYEININDIKGKIDDEKYVSILNKIKEKIRKYDEASNYHMNENGDIIV